MLQTKLTEAYGLGFPFVSAGMGFVALPELVAAVSNAGGLGLLGVSPAPPPGMQAMIRATKSFTSHLVVHRAHIIRRTRVSAAKILGRFADA